MISGFLEAKIPDHRGRMISSMWKQTDHKAEATHDCIHWLFSLDEPNRTVTDSPILSPEDIEEIRASNLAQANLVKPSSWFLVFLERNQHWVTKYDQNHLQITRAIKSLRLLASDKAADYFKSKVPRYAGSDLNLIDSKAGSFWHSA